MNMSEDKITKTIRDDIRTIGDITRFAIIKRTEDSPKSMENKTDTIELENIKTDPKPGINEVQKFTILVPILPIMSTGLNKGQGNSNPCAFLFMDNYMNLSIKLFMRNRALYVIVVNIFNGIVV